MSKIYTNPITHVGIIGGGQLGRMMAFAAHRMGCRATVLDPNPDGPAAQVANDVVVGDVHDPLKVRELVERCDVTTFDIENIQTSELLMLEEEGRAIYPSPKVLRTLQDKLKQKQVYRQAGLPTADFTECDSPSREALAAFGYPLVQKVKRGGYDGRGVAVLRSEDAFDDHLPVPSILERFVKAHREIAVMVARGRDGVSCCYPVVEMTFVSEQNILDTVLAPAAISDEQATLAQQLATRAIETLDGVGIFGVEMFLTEDGEILINEIAPRTHNSGHYTMEACVTDQFEQHLRAVIGLPLGSVELLKPAAMLNLLGAPGHSGVPRIYGIDDALAMPELAIHLYGKAATSAYRKMGHATFLENDRAKLQARVEQLKSLIRIEGDEVK